MSSRTPDQQVFWDLMFEIAFRECVNQQQLRGVMYCIGLAREAADKALAQRDDSVQQSNG